MSSSLYDLDLNYSQVMRAKMVSDIRLPTSMLELEFLYQSNDPQHSLSTYSTSTGSVKAQGNESFPNFSLKSGNYIKLYNREWIPISYRVTEQKSGYYVVAFCYQRAYFKKIDRICTDVSSLSSVAGMSKTSDSENLKFISPQKNQYLGVLLTRYCYNSVTTPVIGKYKPIFAQLRENQLQVNYFETLRSRAKQVLELENFSNYSFVDDSINSQLNSAKFPRVQTYSSQLNLLLGAKLEFISTDAPEIGTVYSSVRLGNRLVDSYFISPCIVVRVQFDTQADNGAFYSYTVATLNPVDSLTTMEVL